MSVETYRSWSTLGDCWRIAASVIQNNVKFAPLLQHIDQAVFGIVETNGNNLALLKPGNPDVRDADLTNFLPVQRLEENFLKGSPQ
jgi:hypothetical protein